MDARPRVLISACLLGVRCRYDGASKAYPEIEELARWHTLIPACPEQLGGLSTPRPPSERQGDRVVANTGADVTMQYRRGAEQALKQTEGSAADKLNAVFGASQILTGGQPGFVSLLLQVAYREDGVLMREKMKASQLGGMQSVLEEILEQGVSEGAFFLSDVSAYAQMLMRLYLAFTDEIAFLLAQEESEEKLVDELVRVLNAYRTAIERVLVAPFGSVVLFEAKELQLLAQTILRERTRRRADALLGK